MSNLQRILLFALSVALYVLSFPPFSLWPLIFVAMVPALVATRGLRPGLAFGWGTAFGFAVSAVGLTWFTQVFGAGAPALWAVLGAWFGLFFAGRAALERRLPPWLALFGTVLWWTAVEFFRAECYPLRCTFLSLGHALAVRSCPLKSAAGILGAYGLGTFIMAANVAIAKAWLRGRNRLRAGLAFVGVALAVFAALAAMAYLARFLSAPRPGLLDDEDFVRVCAVQKRPGSVGEFIRLSRTVAAQRPAWILWPELSIDGDVLADAGLRSRIEGLARDVNAVVGVGCRLRHPDGPPSFWNAYVLFGPDGSHIGTYKKIQPVQFMIDGVPGSDYPVFDTAHGRLGVAICYDGDFTWISRRLVANGAEALVIPIFDPAAWGMRMRQQHLAAAVLRAIENNRCVIRPANTSPTVIIDGSGSVTTRRDDRGPGVLTGRVYLRGSRTFYSRYGWLWPYVCQGAAVILMVWVLIRARRALAHKT